MSESKLVAISSDSDGIFPTDSGVCADGKDELLFVGITRNLAASVSTNRKPVAKLCISLKLLVKSEGESLFRCCSIVQPFHRRFPFLRSQALCGASGDTFCGGVGFATGDGPRLGLCDVQSGGKAPWNGAETGGFS
ncbi:imidazole glycerol phosphate synthase subunit HisH [Striga asiatica]|uniref:Imidazole glycerol phosphate synthase subunit HisH n=1 Tax=Striga asiatica TaxID=4170 RepID=A0A5A7QKB9_STRAF|nr:imidazole glycerol phosphate synthase subunit HisH [Striga asiatica]